MQLEMKTRGPWSYYHLREMEEAGIVHGFMTRSTGPVLRDPVLRKAFTEAFSATEAVVMDQEHGDRVLLVAGGSRPEAGDGLVVTEPGVMGVIKTADCLPIILCEPRYPAAAIVHAGWRGTARKIVQRAVETMAGLGVGRGNMVALIGPGIGPCCYGVGQDVISAFEEAGLADGVFERRNGAAFLDLKEANRRLLLHEGIDRIFDAHLCTSCRGDLFISARRDRGGEGQINFVLLNAQALP